MSSSDLIDYFVVTPHNTVIELIVSRKETNHSNVVYLYMRPTKKLSEEDESFFEENCVVVAVTRIKSLNMFKTKSEAYALLVLRLNKEMFGLKERLVCLYSKIKHINQIALEEHLGE